MAYWHKDVIKFTMYLDDDLFLYINSRFSREGLNDSIYQEKQLAFFWCIQFEISQNIVRTMQYKYCAMILQIQVSIKYFFENGAFSYKNKFGKNWPNQKRERKFIKKGNTITRVADNSDGGWKTVDDLLFDEALVTQRTSNVVERPQTEQSICF